MFSPPTIRDDADGSPILVKHAAGDDRYLLRREAKLLEAASHLNVVKLRGLLELEDRSELMLAYVPGASLAEQPPLSLDALLDVALQLGDTLVGLHEIGIRHGAVTAEHALIDQNGLVVLCGFGSALEVVESAEETSDDVLALAELLTLELARSEDAGLTTLQRREATALHASIRFVAQDRAIHNSAAHNNSGLGNPKLDSPRLGGPRLDSPRLDSTARGAGPDLRRWLAHLSELARTGESAGLRKSSKPLRHWLPQRIPSRRVWLAAAALVAAVGVWQFGFSQSSPDLLASPTSPVSVALPADTQAGALHSSASDETGTGAGGAGIGTNNLTADGRPTGVLVTGLTPERCFDGAASDSAAPNTAPEGLATITTTSELDINGDGCTEKIQIGTNSGAGVVAGQPAIATPTRRWLIGQTDDLVAVGDWNCDGIATPAVLRPTSGEAFFFAVWPYGSPPAQPTSRASVPTGATRVSSLANVAEASPARQCHDLVVWFGEQSLTMSPNHHWSDAALSHFSG